MPSRLVKVPKVVFVSGASLALLRDKKKVCLVLLELANAFIAALYSVPTRTKTNKKEQWTGKLFYDATVVGRFSKQTELDEA